METCNIIMNIISKGYYLILFGKGSNSKTAGTCFCKTPFFNCKGLVLTNLPVES